MQYLDVSLETLLDGQTMPRNGEIPMGTPPHVPQCLGSVKCHTCGHEGLSIDLHSFKIVKGCDTEMGKTPKGNISDV